MWFPMQVGSDEKRFAWMDEGFTQYDQSQAMADFFKGYDDEAENREPYINLAHRGRGGGADAPRRPVPELQRLRHRELLQDGHRPGRAPRRPRQETFEKAFREYGQRWQYKHPMPYDFFDTVEDVSGRDLSWFWRTWFFETWKLDQAIDTVATVGDSLEVVVENRGKALDAGAPGGHPTDGKSRHGGRSR